MFFLPEAGLARKAERDRADYLRWKDEGVLTVTAGNVVDHGAIIAHVVGLGERFGVQEVTIDRWNSTAVNTALQDEGFTINQFGQGFASMAAPVKELKRAILAGHFRHDGNPLLRLCFGNAVAERDAAENEKFTKEKARERGRIDGAVARRHGHRPHPDHRHRHQHLRQRQMDPRYDGHVRGAKEEGVADLRRNSLPAADFLLT